MPKYFKSRYKFLISGSFAFISLVFLGFLIYFINKNNYFSLNILFSNFLKTKTVQEEYLKPLFLLRNNILIFHSNTNKTISLQLEKDIDITIKSLETSFKDLPLEMEDYWTKYKEILVSSIEKNSKEIYTEEQIKDEKESFFELINALELYQKKLFLESKNIYIESIQQNNYNASYIMACLILLGGGVFLINALIIMKTVKDIEAVENGLKYFFDYLKSRKNYITGFNIKVSSLDELGVMAQLINDQVQIVQLAFNNDYLFIQEAIILVQKIQKGNFRERLSSTTSSQDLTTLKNVINFMIDSLEERINNEVKERLSHERILIQQSKLATMGTMLGNIAHQWRQPIAEISAILMGIETQIYFQKINYQQFIKNIHLCNKITEHMSKTISDFQNFFQLSKEKEQFNVLEECQKAIAIISASFAAHNIMLEIHAEENLTIYGYPREFAHAILNILSNAKDIFLERKIIEPKIVFNIKAGRQYAVINIEDNGGGILIENINRVFEPYYSTKYPKQGTGIGLYMCKIIIEKNMRGFLNVKNIRNGACFTIKLK